MQNQSILLIVPSHGTVKIMQKMQKIFRKELHWVVPVQKKCKKNAKMQKCKNAKMQKCKNAKNAKKNKTQSHEHYRNAIFS